jgi:hypothetical protein
MDVPVTREPHRKEPIARGQKPRCSAPARRPRPAHRPERTARVMRLEAVTDGVFECRETPLMLDASVIPVLLEAAERRAPRSARVCMHGDDEASSETPLLCDA